VELKISHYNMIYEMYFGCLGMYKCIEIYIGIFIRKVLKSMLCNMDYVHYFLFAIISILFI